MKIFTIIINVEKSDRLRELAEIGSRFRSADYHEEAALVKKAIDAAR